MIEQIISKLKFNRGVQFGLLIFGTIIVPYMFLFQFVREVFDKNQMVQLLLISLSIGVPIAIIITVLTIVDHLVLDPSEKDKLIDHRISQMGTACAMTACAFYIPCVFKYFEPSLSQRQAILFMTFFLGAIIISSIISIANGSTKKTYDAITKLKDAKKKP